MRKDKAHNQALIERAFFDLVDLALAEKKRRVLPTIEQLAEKTGLSMRTIAKHFKGLPLAPGIVRPEMHLLTDNVLSALYQSAIDGSVPAQKLWFQIVSGWRESQSFEISQEIEINFADD